MAIRAGSETGELTAGSTSPEVGVATGVSLGASDAEGLAEDEPAEAVDGVPACGSASPVEQPATASTPTSAIRRTPPRPGLIGSSCPNCDDVAVTSDHQHSVRTFKKRSGRVTSTQEDALDRLWPRFGVPLDGTRLDLPALFGRTAPVVLEIGFGMGESTAAMAQAQPELDVLAIDVHTPGHGNLLKLVEAAELTNVRLVSGDARVLLTAMLPLASLQAVRVFFPDPWPKARHVKRRLVTLEFAGLVAGALVDGGTLHVATDIQAYAEQARAVVGVHPDLQATDQPPWRARTKFEHRGLDAGRQAYDLGAMRLPREITA